MRHFSVIIWVLAIAISSLTTFLISFINEIPQARLWLIFAIVFFSSLLLSYVIFKLLIIRDVKKIESFIYAWLDDKPGSMDPQPSYFFSRFTKMENALRFVNKEKEVQIDELKKLADFRREFIANISHELKTPIFSAQGFVHTLLDGAIKDKNVRLKFLRKAAKALDALDLLVQDLLTLSQIEIGDIKMHFEYFDIVKLTNEIIDQLEERAEKKEVRISVEAKQKKILVYADYQRIHQVLNNLLINAIKYNKEGGAVKVTFKQAEDSVVIRVADTGEGISQEHHKRIFERFYRVEKSRSRRKGGTGLGLAIVKHILEGHNTSVHVSSKVGDGTIFSFKLAQGEKEWVENSNNVKI